MARFSGVPATAVLAWDLHGSVYSCTHPPSRRPCTRPKPLRASHSAFHARSRTRTSEQSSAQQSQLGALWQRLPKTSIASCVHAVHEICARKRHGSRSCAQRAGCSVHCGAFAGQMMYLSPFFAAPVQVHTLGRRRFIKRRNSISHAGSRRDALIETALLQVLGSGARASKTEVGRCRHSQSRVGRSRRGGAPARPKDGSGRVA